MISRLALGMHSGNWAQVERFLKGRKKRSREFVQYHFIGLFGFINKQNQSKFIAEIL